ncbi:Genome sequencing data, contig C301 (fragment) [Microcystis aeruginosa PCC 9807]|uniref:Genome sequencing data, contig C301 n=1 Tax=Microcystis aeruginosa PCC 9807 TaxID=1160283 RepID=I4HF18_MICAE
MINPVPLEILQNEKALGTVNGPTQQPLVFQFYYGQSGKAEIINTIYLEDGNQSSKLHLEVSNLSKNIIVLNPPPAEKLATVAEGGANAASAGRCHFQLRWEKDLGLKPSQITIENPKDWMVNYDEEGNFFSMYFLRTTELALNPKEKIELGFLNLTANNRTVKSSNVELLYGGIGLISTKPTATATATPLKEPVSSKNAISIINYPSKTQIPLQFRVLGSNAILNDGTTQNTLKLKVLNSPLSNNTRPILLLNQSSKFIVSFEQGDDPDALVKTTSQLNNVQIQVTDTNSWKPEHTANSTQWSFTPTASLKQLTAGKGIELTISNLVTSSASGLACIYIDYQNIGSYPDGRLVIPIEKTPLLYSGGQVGIGTKTFDRETIKLKVNGDIVLGKDETNKKFIFHSRTDGGGDFLQITHDDTDDWWEWNQGITLRRGGNVGIGITDPAAKLHVNGGDAVISGKVAIRTTNPKIHLAIGDDDTGLQQQGDGELAIYTDNIERVRVAKNGNVGIGTTTPKIHLAIGDDDTGLKQQGDGILAIYTNNAERVRIHSDGKVGIGTSSYIGSDRLIIQSAANEGTLRLLGPGNKLGIGGKLNFGGAEEVYLTENLDKKLLIHADTQITLDSPSVGIGTTTPKAKLDVEGSVKFGIEGTIVNRMICGQVYFDTERNVWFYKSYGSSDQPVFKKDTGKFKIPYGFTVQHPQELVILATTLDQWSNNVACVSEIQKDYCVICITDTKTQQQKPTNFSFVIMHFQSWPGRLPQYGVEGQGFDSGWIPDIMWRKTSVPIEPYSYPWLV